MSDKTYEDGYLDALHDIKVDANGLFVIKTTLGWSLSRSDLNLRIDELARRIKRNVS